MRKIFNLWAAFSAAFLFAFSPVAALAGTTTPAAPAVPASLTRLFTSSTTDTVPSWATGAYITEVGGGGAGMGWNGAVVGGGGASGNAFNRVFASVTPGATLTITVGAGGVGVAGASGIGGAGGNSSVTGTLTFVPVATGGAAAPATGGTGGTGNYALGSFPGYYGPYMVGSQSGGANGTNALCVQDGSSISSGGAGTGGCTPWGKPGVGNNPAASGTGYGSGGNGVSGGSTAFVAGSGAPGFVLINYVQ